MACTAKHALVADSPLVYRDEWYTLHGNDVENYAILQWMGDLEHGTWHVVGLGDGKVESFKVEAAGLVPRESGLLELMAADCSAGRLVL